MFSPRHPLGVSRTRDGLRFAVLGPADQPLTLALHRPGAAAAFSEHVLEPELRDEQDVRTIELHGLPSVFEYTWRVGPGPPVCDPYARLIAGGETWGRSDDLRGTGVGRRHRGLYVAGDDFDWQGVRRPRVEPRRRVVYELHVRGFTRHASAGVERPGTYLGLVEKIPYLRRLGVTTIELMPILEFDETDNPRRDPATDERLLNFWGYHPISFFAPKAGYASDPAPGAAARELKTLVRELHRAGLEVVLDVVYNHTAEGTGGAGDPLLGWRALAEEVYYLRDPRTGARLDLTGCGNTVNVQHPVVRRMILDSLRHWVTEYRVDGFRFDLAGVLWRGEHAELLERPPLVAEIARDPVLHDRLLIAEPWDATGFTPAAGFPAPWLEWDGEFRDELRRWAGGLAAGPQAVAARLGGQGAKQGQVPAHRCVRFVACHDGRTLADVVTFARKHNEANGEGNRDGWDGEVAWNGGVEGPSDDPDLAARREREVRLLLALWTVAPGTLQLTAGDELGRSQRGNSNAWCQDNETGWVVWPAAGDDRSRQRRDLVGKLLQLRERLSLSGPLRSSIVAPLAPAPSFPSTESLGLSAFLLVALCERGEGGGQDGGGWLVAANPAGSACRFPVPRAPAGLRWRLRADTSAAAAAEVVRLGDDAPFLAATTTEIEVAPRAARIFVAERPD